MASCKRIKLLLLKVSSKPIPFYMRGVSKIINFMVLENKRVKIIRFKEIT